MVISSLSLHVYINVYSKILSVRWLCTETNHPQIFYAAQNSPKSKTAAWLLLKWLVQNSLWQNSAKSFHVRTHGHTPNHSSLLDPHATHPAAHSSRCAHSSSFSVLLLFSSSLSFLSHSLKALIHLKCHLLLFPFSCTIIQLYRANNAILPT